MTETLAPASAGGTDYYCPVGAYDRRHPDLRPKTGSLWQAVWDHPHGFRPMPGFEELVVEILAVYGEVFLYEPLMAPIPCGPADPNQAAPPRIRRFLRNDIYLPNRGIIIEIYSGNSPRGERRKRNRLQRMSELHGIPHLLLTPVHWLQLNEDYMLLLRWIDELAQPCAA